MERTAHSLLPLVLFIHITKAKITRLKKKVLKHTETKHVKSELENKR